LPSVKDNTGLYWNNNYGSLNGCHFLFPPSFIYIIGTSPHQVGKNSNNCHRVAENTEVLSACRNTASAKDANDVVYE
jgi:hypothetical protein